MSGSRAGVLGLAATLLSFSWYCRSVAAGRVAALVIVVLIAIGGTGLAELGNSEAINRLVGQGSEEERYYATASNVGRLEKLRDARDQFLSRPFIGTGLYNARSAHNVFVSVLVSTGILGFAGWLTVTIATIRSSIVVRRRFPVRPPDMALFVYGWTASFLGLLVANVFQNALWERFVWVAPSLILLAQNRLMDAVFDPTRSGGYATGATVYNHPDLLGRR
jgi:O-antigen ligase